MLLEPCEAILDPAASQPDDMVGEAIPIAIDAETGTLRHQAGDAGEAEPVTITTDGRRLELLVKVVRDG
jgi:hypothetical protein